jgi:hypothetical protein
MLYTYLPLNVVGNVIFARIFGILIYKQLARAGALSLLEISKQ